MLKSLYSGYTGSMTYSCMYRRVQHRRTELRQQHIPALSAVFVVASACASVAMGQCAEAWRVALQCAMCVEWRGKAAGGAPWKERVLVAMVSMVCRFVCSDREWRDSDALRTQAAEIV